MEKETLDGPPYACEYCGAEESQKGRPFMTPQQLGGHVRACRKNPDSYLYEGPSEGPDAPPPGGETPSRSPSSPSQGEAPPGGFYPLIEELERAEVGEEAGDGPLVTLIEEGGEAPAAETTPKLMETRWVWKGFGRFLDETLLKDAPVKCDITDEKARVLDESFQAMGFTVTENPNPIELPYYLPFLVTAGGSFGLPLAVYAATKAGRTDLFFGGEEDGGEAEA